MKTIPAQRSAAFTLIEMIGVLAVMSILAAVIAPNILRSIDRATTVAEVQALDRISAQTKSYLHDYGTVPPVATWNTNIATYSDLSATDVLTNKRNINRVYLLDPASNPTPRVLILSCLKAGLTLPTTATATQFSQIWSTQDGSIPPGWSANWAPWADYLVIERLNLNSEYRTIILQNNSNQTGSPSAPAGVSVSFRVNAVKSVTPIQSGTIAVGSAGRVILSGLVPNERVSLYTDATYTNLNYVYVVGADSRNLDFDGSHWK